MKVPSETLTSSILCKKKNNNPVKILKCKQKLYKNTAIDLMLTGECLYVTNIGS